MEISVLPFEIGKGELKNLVLKVSFKKLGLYKLKSVTFLFLGAVRVTQEFTDKSKYSTVLVSTESAFIDVKAAGLKQVIYFGEVNKSILSITDLSESDVDELYLISCEPLFTGFGFKDLGKINAGETKEVDLYVRGTIEKLSFLPLFFVYKSKDQWRFCMYNFSMKVKKSFNTRYYSEDL